MDKLQASDHPAPPAGAANLHSLIGALRDWLRDLVNLAALEGRLAGAGLALTFALGAGAAALLMTGWLALVGAGVVALVEYQVLGWVASLAFAALMSFAAAGMLVLLALRRSRHPLFCATRRQLGLQAAPATASPSAQDPDHE
jgi:hypothetical protein